jgi:hypothetical protein
MSREPNTDKTGNRFASATVQAIWEKATPIPSVNKKHQTQRRLWQRNPIARVRQANNLWLGN